MKKTSHGFTLLEMVISIAVFVLVFSAISLVLNRSIIVYQNLNNQKEASQRATTAMEWLVRDISEADCVYDVTTNSIAVTTPARGYAKYFLQPSTTLKRRACSGGATVDSIVTENIANFNVSTYNATNQSTSSVDSTDEVEITLQPSLTGQAFTLNTVASPDSCTSGCQFAKTFGTNGIDKIYFLQQTSDGGFILGGYTSANFDDILVIKTNARGNVIWAKNYSSAGSNQELLYSLQQTSDNGYILGGNTTGSGGYDILVIKTDGNGTILWQNSYGIASRDEKLNSLQQTTDGGYILGGNTNAPQVDFLVIKTDQNGAILWQKTYGGVSPWETLYSLQQTSDGGYILGGNTTSNGNDILVIKTDQNGAILWQNTYGTVGAEYLNSLQQTSDGGYIFGGYTGTSGQDFLVIKTDQNGAILWQKTYNNGGSEFLESIRQTADGGYILGGTTGGDFWVIKTDQNGAILWQKTYGSGWTESLEFLQKTSDGGYILGGHRSISGNIDFHLVKTDSLGNVTCCDTGYTITPTSITPGTPSVSSSPTTFTPVNYTITPAPSSKTANDATLLPGWNVSSVCPPP